MRRLICSALMLAGLWNLSNNSGAACVCRCVGGEVKALCSSSIDLPPICSPQICPITPPSIAPIQSPRVPPLGTTGCRMAQVLNPQTGQYEWREICR